MVRPSPFKPLSEPLVRLKVGAFGAIRSSVKLMAWEEPLTLPAKSTSVAVNALLPSVPRLATATCALPAARSLALMNLLPTICPDSKTFTLLFTDTCSREKLTSTKGVATLVTPSWLELPLSDNVLRTSTGAVGAVVSMRTLFKATDGADR